MLKQLKERVQIGTTPDGKPLYKWATGYSKQEVLLTAIEILQIHGLISEGQSKPFPESPLLNRYIDDWWQLYKEPKLRHTTKTSYYNIISHHIKPFFKGLRIEEVTTSHIQRFYNAHSDMAKSTVRIMSVILRQVLDLAVEDRFIDRNPAASKRLSYSGHVKIRSSLNDHAVHDILEHLPELEGSDRILLSLLIFTGVRRGEALALRWENIDWKKRLIHIEKSVTFFNNQPVLGETKSRAGQRVIPLDDELAAILMPYRQLNGFIIGDGKKPLTERAFTRTWSRIGKCIDLHGATPHIFRHTYITLAASSGVDIKTLQEIAGHSDIRMTMEKYADKRESKVMEAREQIRRVFESM